MRSGNEINGICKWLDVLVISDKDDKPQAPSPASSLLWSAGDVKEPTHLSQSAGHEVPGVVAWSLPVVLSRLIGVGNTRRY